MNRLQHALLTLLATLALAASAAAIGLSLHNAGLRRDIGQQQLYVQQSVQLENLYRELARALAELSARHPDDALRALLQRHGISFTPGTAAAPTPQPGRK